MSMCFLCRLPVAKNHDLSKFWLWGLLYRPPFYRLGPNLVCYSRPTVHVYASKLVSIGILCCLWRRETQIFAIFWTSAFSDVDIWQQSEKVEHRNYKPSPIQRHQNRISTPTPSWRNRANKLWRSKAWRTDKAWRADKKRFSPPRRRMNFEPHQTWHGDKGPRARSCTSKTFVGLTHSFAARGTENLGVTRPRQIKTPITPKPLEQIQRN